MGDVIADGDAENPLFAAPMQLLQPDPTHHFLVPVPETMEQLNKIDCPVNIITGVWISWPMWRVDEPGLGGGGGEHRCSTLGAVSVLSTESSRLMAGKGS